MSDFVDPISSFPGSNPPPPIPDKKPDSQLKRVLIICGVLAIVFIVSELQKDDASRSSTQSRKIESSSQARTEEASYARNEAALQENLKQSHQEYGTPTEEELEKKWGANSSDGPSSKVLSASERKPFIEISKVAKKTKSQVDAYLGKPGPKQTINPSNTPCPCDKYVYKNGSVEVVYVNGKADWITVNNLNSWEFEPNEVMKSIGIYTNPAPRFNGEGQIRWFGVNGYVEINASPGAGTETSFVFVQAITDL